MLNRLMESTGIPVKGNIRLGTRIDGKLENKAHFVLTEVPEVVEVYGPEPEFLEVMFPGDDLNAVAPTALEYWTGTRGKDGSIIDGAMVCSGPGPFADGSPGIAIWKDRNRMPPQDDCMGERDPKSGYVQRYCRGEGCSDWLDLKGFPKCKQTMRLYFILPRVSPTNVYRITTHAWNSMYDFYRLLDWVRKTEGLAFKPFKIYKEAKTVKHWDAAKGREYQRAIPILRVEKDDMFMQLYGAGIQERLKLLRDNRFYLMAPPESEPLLLDSEAGVAEEAQPTELTPAQRADAVLADPEVILAFEQLEVCLGRAMTHQQRQLYVLKKAGGADLRIDTLDGLQKSIVELMARAQTQPPLQPEPEPVGVAAEPVAAEPVAVEPPPVEISQVDPLPV